MSLKKLLSFTLALLLLVATSVCASAESDISSTNALPGHAVTIQINVNSSNVVTTLSLVKRPTESSNAWVRIQHLTDSGVWITVAMTSTTGNWISLSASALNGTYRAKAVVNFFDGDGVQTDSITVYSETITI